MPRDDEKRDYLPEAASDPHLPALAPDRAKNASQPELHDLRAEEGCVSVCELIAMGYQLREYGNPAWVDTVIQGKASLHQSGNPHISN